MSEAKLKEHEDGFWEQMEMDLVFDSLDKVIESTEHLKVVEIFAILSLMTINLAEQTDNGTSLIMHEIEKMAEFFKDEYKRASDENR